MPARRFLLAGLLAPLLAPLVGAAARAGLPAPTGRVVLTVTASGQDATDLDLAAIESLGLVTVATVTPWTEGVQQFEGVPLAALIDALAPGAATVQATAINDYAVEIPVEDARRYRVIVATRRNGRPMSVRDKGPLWIIYPWSAHPEIDEPTYHARSIWQLRTMALR